MLLTYQTRVPISQDNSAYWRTFGGITCLEKIEDGVVGMDPPWEKSHSSLPNWPLTYLPVVHGKTTSSFLMIHLISYKGR